VPIPFIAAIAARIGPMLARGAEMGKTLFSRGWGRRLGPGVPPRAGGRGGAPHPKAPVHPAGPKHGPGGGPADRPGREDEGDKKLNRLWRYDTTWNLIQRVNGLIAENAHSFTHAISVAVVGGPHADLRRCWYLALSAAFGRYRRRVKGIGEANIEAVWDITGKSVHVSIAYVGAGLSNLISEAKNDIDLRLGSDASGNATAITNAFVGGIFPIIARVVNGAAARNFIAGGQGIVLTGGIELLQVGPDQVTVGGGWPNWLLNSPGANIFNPITNIVSIAINLLTPPLAERGIVWSNVNDSDCTSDTNLNIKFTKDPLIDVFKELPVNDADGIRCPWGAITPINIAASGLFSKRGNTSFTGPTLPDDGRVLTTGEKRDVRIQPPRPAIDGKSRESLVDLIVAALHQPCNAPHSVGCQPGPVGSQGIRTYPAGKGLEGRQFQQAWQSVRNPEMLDATLPAKNVPRLTK